MSKALIKLMYRQLIDSNSENGFEKAIWKATYDEFLLKSQTYNSEHRYQTFRQMVKNDGRANSLHYKCGFAAAGFMDALQNKMPVIKDVLERSLAFETDEFMVIDSDITNINAHKIAIQYTTPLLTCYDAIADCFLLSSVDTATSGSPSMVQAFMLKMQTRLGIVSYQAL